MRLVWLPLLGLAMAGCASDAAQPADATPAPTIQDAALLQHERCVPGAPTFVESDSLLKFETSSVSPGDTLAFRWLVDGRDFEVADESVVECFTGDGWEWVWLAEGLFTVPSTRLLEDDSVAAGTDDGWTENRGQIAVPLEAVPGDYRVVMSLVTDQAITDHEARFAVS